MLDWANLIGVGLGSAIFVWYTMSLNHRVESVVHSPPYIISPTNCTHIFVDKLLGFSVDFFFKQKTAYEIGVRLVGSEMCIRDSS